MSRLDRGGIAEGRNAWTGHWSNGARRGDRDAYEALAHGSARRLYLTAYRIVRDADQAEDAVQQTLVAMWRELPSLRDLDRFDSWTYRLVVRFCLAESTRHRRATAAPASVRSRSTT